MSSPDLIKQLTDLLERNPEDLYNLSLKIVAGQPELEEHLKDQYRKLQLAKNRELMDDYQIKLAYRLTIKNMIKALKEK